MTGTITRRVLPGLMGPKVRKPHRPKELAAGMPIVKFIAVPVLLLIHRVASGPEELVVKRPWQPPVPNEAVGAAEVAPVFGTTAVEPLPELLVPFEPFEPLVEPFVDPLEPLEALAAGVVVMTIVVLPEDVPVAAVLPVTGTAGDAAATVLLGAGVTVAGFCGLTLGVSKAFPAAIPVAATAVC